MGVWRGKIVRSEFRADHQEMTGCEISRNARDCVCCIIKGRMMQAALRKYLSITVYTTRESIEIEKVPFARTVV